LIGFILGFGVAIDVDVEAAITVDADHPRVSLLWKVGRQPARDGGLAGSAQVYDD
jgi:hypothetical protein